MNNESSCLQELAHAIRVVRESYGRHLGGGPAFRLHDPVVESAKSSQPAEWFYSQTESTGMTKANIVRTR